MKKFSKINLTLDKEVISSLSGNEMNTAKGGAISDVPYNCEPIYSRNINNCDFEPITVGVSCNNTDCLCETINQFCLIPITPTEQNLSVCVGTPCQKPKTIIGC